MSIHNIYKQQGKNAKKVTRGESFQLIKGHSFDFFTFSGNHSQDSIQIAPILQPTEEQFQDFSAYMGQVEQKYQNNFGMVKIIPPSSWRPRSTPYNQALQNLRIRNPISQQAQGKGGIYEFQHITLESTSYEKFCQQNRKIERSLENKDVHQIQQLFWKSIVSSPPIYGADLTASLMDQSAGKWNLDKLDTILRKAFHQQLRGITNSYCYIGSWRSLFCWHKEDIDLSAINFLHQGKSKFWYCIQPDDAIILENDAKRQYSTSFSQCSQYLRHKTILINPYLLKKNHPSLKICKVEQRPGQFIVAFNNAYHCGFNMGVNVAEAVNFATFEWINLLKKIKYCHCRKSAVKSDYALVMAELEKCPQILNRPEFISAKNQQNKVQQNVRRMPTKKNQRKQQKIQRKKLEKDPTTSYVQCDSCATWRIVPSSCTQDFEKQSFNCNMFGNKCKTIKSSKTIMQEPESEYLPY